MKVRPKVGSSLIKAPWPLRCSLLGCQPGWGACLKPLWSGHGARGWRPQPASLVIMAALPLCSGGTPRLAVDLAAVVHRGLFPLHCRPPPGSHSPPVSSVSGTLRACVQVCALEFSYWLPLECSRRLGSVMAGLIRAGKESERLPSPSILLQRKGDEYQRSTESPVIKQSENWNLGP